MKKIFLFAGLLFTTDIMIAQLPTKKVTVKPAAAKPLLKTLNDSVSYIVGVSLTNFYKAQGIFSPNLNATVVSKGITDALAGKPSLIDNATANTLMNKYLTMLQEEKVKTNIVAGQKFLAQNKLRPEVKTTASGLQYEIITQGNGAKPDVSDSVTFNYKGTYINGTEFDNSYNHGGPITFAMNHVIRGWTEGLQLMNVGSKYKFYVPYTLGYGAFDYNDIPGGSALIFEVELLATKKNK
jgi:FKBP-type peptidyl-prolyl cis-trans isomerase